MKILDNSDKFLLPLLPHIILQKTGKAPLKIKFIGGGSFGRVFLVICDGNEKFVLKAYRVPGSELTEAEQLHILGGSTDVKMPRVLFTYEDESAALLAMSFVEGKNVLSPSFLVKSKSQKKQFAEEVISGMLRWHNHTNDKFGCLSAPSYESWYSFYKAEKQSPWLKALRELNGKGKFSSKKLKLLLEATEIFNSLPEENTSPVLIHGDLNIMNIMADEKTFALTGFIDPCGSLWADREYDLFQLRNMWGDVFGLYKTYKEKCGLSEYADFRVAYYAAMHEASMRLSGGLTVPLWEELNNIRLKKEMKKLKEKM